MYVKSIDEEPDGPEVPVRLENLISLWNDYMQVQCGLEAIEDPTDEQLKKDRIRDSVLPR